MVVLLICGWALSACGGTSSSSIDGAVGGAGAPTSTVSSGSGSNTSEPSAEFRGKGLNGVLASAGKESTVAERQAASAVLEKSFEARVAGDWATQCETLTAALIKQLEQSASKGNGKMTCPASLEALAGKAKKAALENTMIQPLAALRVNHGQAFAFYHGAGGKDYVIPMAEEGGQWKVVVLTPQEAP
jgi:hypothetical protein